MNKIKIITDSTNDLDPSVIAEKDIVVVPLIVNFGEESYYDGVDLKVADLYEKVAEKNELPKTAAISIGAFMEIFQKYVDEGYDVIYTGISRQMSRTFENAYMAAQEVDENHVFVVDSKNLSTGIGLLLLKACKYRDSGLGAKEIVANLERDRELVLSQFVIETMDYLHKGGRCSSVTKLLGTMLKIKPMIAVRDGKMHVAKKPRGKMKVGLDMMLDQLREDLPRLDKDCIMVTHSIAYEHCEYLVEEIKKMVPDVLVLSSVAGCVISSHCGKGTIGILYMVNE